MSTKRSFKSILVANRGEIAIRVMRAATEMRIRTVAVYSAEDRFALHRSKADESYLIGVGSKPIAAYLDIDEMLRVARMAGVDAVHPGYGFLSENPEFADACEEAGIFFIGPKSSVMRTLGNKVAARNLAQSVGVPVMPATPPLSVEPSEAILEAEKIGFPVMLKASWGGGGRGMRVIKSREELLTQMPGARNEARSAFGNDEIYLEKLVEKARHVEVQILGDKHGELIHLYERDCSVERRNQKVVERAPATYLTPDQRENLCESALRLGRAVQYTHAGTVEFLMDSESGNFYFIEVNPRIQVEHTITEQVTGIDLVKAQIAVAQGHAIGEPDSFVPVQEQIRLNGHALQCRVTTEDPENNFVPDYGKITTYRSAGGFGVRLDSGTAYAGAVVTPHYDSLLAKVTTWGTSEADAIARMDRSLQEFRIRGVSTNLAFLENVIRHPVFQSGACTTRFIEQTPDLLKFKGKRDRATKLLKYLGNVSVNGHPEMKGRVAPSLPLSSPIVPSCDLSAKPPAGTRDRLHAMGTNDFLAWIKGHKRVLFTDTTMRDAHQSLLATRMRTYDIVKIAPHYAQLLPDLFSIECWGGATFDVAMRFLNEDPWDRLNKIRDHVPNVLLQMLLRASNAVGYTNYPDNVVRYFISQAAKNGIDIFRVFDSLNVVENMRVAIDAVRETGALCEAAICYTGDLFDEKRSRYSLPYYVNMAKDLEKAGAQILAIKDMAGVCRPRAATELIRTLKSEIGIPIHFHTHDTSGLSGASVLAAVEAGCDIVDGAIDSMSGLTSQPSIGSLVAALEGHPRDPGLSRGNIRDLSQYWEGVRIHYKPFESDIRCGTSDVYRHEMPGGQYTNLREQARSLGLEHRWPDIAETYAQVNLLFGDIVKVTPTSKVVGDMALFMVANDLTPQDVLDSDRDLDFPESVVQLMRGELGFPSHGFPRALQNKVLRGQQPIVGRPGESLPSVDLGAERERAQKLVGRALSDQELASFLMYPKVFQEFSKHLSQYGSVSSIPTPTFLYGPQLDEEVAITIDTGKTLLVKLEGSTPPDKDGICRLFFELNGQPKSIHIAKSGAIASGAGLREVDAVNELQVASPMPGTIIRLAVNQGQHVNKGDVLVAIEAMKMETLVCADRKGTIARVYVNIGDVVKTRTLLIEMAP